MDLPIVVSTRGYPPLNPQTLRNWIVTHKGKVRVKGNLGFSPCQGRLRPLEIPGRTLCFNVKEGLWGYLMCRNRLKQMILDLD